MTDAIKQKIQNAYTNERCLSIIECEEFYFQKAKDVLDDFLAFELTESQRTFLNENIKNYNLLKQRFEQDGEYKEIGTLIFTIVSYCDANAYRKQELNAYPDKRVLALAYVRMNNWVEQLLAFKFNLTIPDGSPKNAITYLQDPISNFTMLSENHRDQLVKGLFEKTYQKSNVVDDLLEYFRPFAFKVNNQKNYTHLLSRICYFIDKEWKENLIGLMIADSTEWQAEIIKGKEESNFVTCWNHKRPTGTDKTIKLLRESLEENGSFKIYYTTLFNVQYIAEVVDFVVSQKELEEAGWPERYGQITNYFDKFEDYHDDNKNAKIVYLAHKFYKAEPLIHYTDFEFQGTYGYPSVGSQTPIVSYTTKSEIMDQKNINKATELLKYKKQIILQGPPGTGKTRMAEKIAENLFDSSHTTVLKKPTEIGIESIKLFVKEGLILRSVTDYTDYEITQVKGGSFAVKTHSTGKEYSASFNNIIKYYKDETWSKVGTIKYGNDPYEAAIAKYIYEQIDAVEQNENSKSSDRLRIMQFHPSFTYEDFVRGIETEIKDDKLAYVAKNKQLVLMANEAIINPSKNYILILDEINRANLSAVLGELIYALEYRCKSVESMYKVDGSTKISLPDNLYIIGTMNTADRSVGHIDYAIRRRFAFVDILPRNLNSELGDGFDQQLFNNVAKLFVKDYNPTVDYSEQRDLLKNSIYLSPEFRPEDVWLGHSYFIEKEGATMDMRLEYEIKPILLEYIKDGVLKEEARPHVLALPNEIQVK
ncbi:AAA family ATPase [Sphingobacterium sp. LRF_L2]|uniref:AAA family ATPase n=1 Tax=Sphingobacterium sp. LRF_L2 TaxID=3369421 RepID=UPI003F60B33D